MTIAVSIKVNDGIVLASDSATTMMDQESGRVVTVYNNANKIFNLCKRMPIGVITWGLGNFGHSSIATLAKDFRVRISADKTVFDPEKYTILDVARKFVDFMHKEHYLPAVTTLSDDKLPLTGFVIAGYSSGASVAEMYGVNLFGRTMPELTEFYSGEQAGLRWDGQPEAITRMIMGFAPELPGLLQEVGVADNLLEKIKERLCVLQQPLIMPSMPIQDTIDLAEYLVDLTVRFARFRPGVPTVGGPIEIASITKHEGFKWSKRKHYFDSGLNRDYI